MISRNIMELHNDYEERRKKVMRMLKIMISNYCINLALLDLTIYVLFGKTTARDTGGDVELINGVRSTRTTLFPPEKSFLESHNKLK